MFFDPLYLLFALPGFLLALIASGLTKSTFAKYSHVYASSRLTGAEAARRLLADAGIANVPVEEVGGFLSDHYDPSARVLRLSHDVYANGSLSAIGVACHEAGHAIQHATNYGFLGMRTALVPAATLGSNVSYVFLLLGLIFHSQGMLLIGVGLFSLAVLFTIVTLPVEYDASARAKKLMVSAGIVEPGSEAVAAGRVLNAAFLTYVAAAVNAILILLYYLLRSGLLGGRRD